MSPKDEQRKPSVLSELPTGRPQLRSQRRAGATEEPEAPAKPAPRPKAASKPRATAPAKPAATSKTKAAAKPKPKAASKPKPKAAPKPKAKAAAPREAEPAAPPPKSGDRPFVATAIQAAGELAQIGIAVGARAVRNALDRLPKP